MALGIYAGPAATSLTILPSPVALTPSNELIWSENTGRAQSGVNKAKMIGDVVAEKQTYAIKWGILTETEYVTIKSKLTAGFFYFAAATSAQTAAAAAKRYYRSQITGEVFSVGSAIYYKDVEVSVIEQ